MAIVTVMEFLLGAIALGILFCTAVLFVEDNCRSYRVRHRPT
jgi:hypothetical protein